jgi:hypothetical protein
MAANTDKKKHECLDCDDLVRIKKAGSSEGLLDSKAVLLYQAVLLHPKVGSDLISGLVKPYKWDAWLTSSVFIDVIVAKYIENIRASVLSVRDVRLF